MLLKRYIRIFVALFSLLLILCVFISHMKAGSLKRDPSVLMNVYYQKKTSNPQVARQALELILKQNKNHILALVELSQWLVKEKDFMGAMPYVERLHQQLPDNQKYTFQLAYLYYKAGLWERAKPLFLTLASDPLSSWSRPAQAALRAMTSYIPNYKDWVDAKFFYPAWSSSHEGHETEEDELDVFYRLRKKDPTAARVYIESINHTHPKRVQALKEAGFLAIEEGRIEEAVEIFTRVYAMTQDPAEAMQIGYLYSGLYENRKAYHYFNLATASRDPKISWLAQDAMTRFAGQQTKAFPKPYYGEIFAMPFTQNRFGITVTQFIGRLGVELDLPMRPRVYTYTRRTQDNRANDLGELTQLFEDNVWVTGVGGQAFPFKHLPLFIYVEAGAALDLYDRARERWRPDLRAGFMYYQEVGARPSYFTKPTYSTNYYAIWYAEMTYFSRYDNNVIASVRTHQGIRLFQYKSSMVNLFVRGRVIEDTLRDFYNNFAELGPGLAIIPSNRYNFEIHLDYINGMYLPAGGRQHNPYNKYYSNKRALLQFYAKI
ncbi:MAG: hypothetical protein P1U36_09675 [Legionellaceae bacterium]|nr:hypothetical protein [Legionellaceae bacterium]